MQYSIHTFFVHNSSLWSEGLSHENWGEEQNVKADKMFKLYVEATEKYCFACDILCVHCMPSAHYYHISWHIDTKRIDMSWRFDSKQIGYSVSS